MPARAIWPFRICTRATFSRRPAWKTAAFPLGICCFTAPSLFAERWASACSCEARSRPARPQIDARRRRDHLPDLQDVSHSAGQVPADVVRLDRRRDCVTISGMPPATPTCRRRARAHRHRPNHIPGSPVRGRGHGRFLLGGLVRHPRQHLRQLPDCIRLTSRQAVGRGQHSVAGGHVGRLVSDLARTGDDGHHPAVRSARRSSASASWALPSANRSGPRRCGSPAASSPRSPTSAPT